MGRRQIRWAITAFAIALGGSPASVASQGVLYAHPEAPSIRVLSMTFGEDAQEMDVYRPPATFGDGPHPVVVFVMGFPDSSFPSGPLKNHPHYTSWARLVAAHGMVGVTYATSSPASDLPAVVSTLRSQPDLGIDGERIGLWAASGNGPVALKYVRASPSLPARALVLYYPLLPTPDGYQLAAIEAMSTRSGFELPPYEAGDAYPTTLPMYLVRAGQDRSAELLSSIDQFAAFAVRENLRITVRNYPEGHHSFDSTDDTDETRQIIAETLGFLRRHLQSAPRPR